MRRGQNEGGAVMGMEGRGPPKGPACDRKTLKESRNGVAGQMCQLDPLASG